jgi:hypothetical protein
MAADSYEGLAMGGRLVGIAEIAELLFVSRQRADQLTRSKGWPEPIDRVAPIDQYTLNAIHLLFELTGGSVTEAQAVTALESGAQKLPSASPRFWRFADVLRWASEHGRQLNDGGSTSATQDGS